jgi:hypothetical protein
VKLGCQDVAMCEEWLNQQGTGSSSLGRRQVNSLDGKNRRWAERRMVLRSAEKTSKKSVVYVYVVKIKTRS